MKIIKDIITLPILAGITFAAGFLYYWGSIIAGYLEVDYILNCVLFVPFAYGPIIGGLVNSAINNRALKAFGGLVCGFVAVYANFVWSVHGEFSIWLFGLGDLLTAMRMVADMHDIYIVGISFTGSWLVFAYWLEAIVLVMLSLSECVKSNGESEESEKQPQSATTAKRVSTVLVLCALCACLTGCSKDEPKILSKPDAQALQVWAGKQKWSDYELGKSVVEQNMGGEVIVIGIGVTDIPANPKLIEPNQVRTVALALRALSKKVKTVSVDDVRLVFNEDIEMPNGNKRRVSVLAGVK